MIGLEDRRVVARNILMAHSDGARLRLACETAGIDVRTLQRWKAGEGLVAGDGRPAAVHPVPAHALSAAERAEVLRVVNERKRSFNRVPCGEHVDVIRVSVGASSRRRPRDQRSAMAMRHGSNTS